MFWRKTPTKKKSFEWCYSIRWKVFEAKWFENSSVHSSVLYCLRPQCCVAGPQEQSPGRNVLNVLCAASLERTVLGINCEKLWLSNTESHTCDMGQFCLLCESFASICSSPRLRKWRDGWGHGYVDFWLWKRLERNKVHTLGTLTCSCFLSHLLGRLSPGATCKTELSAPRQHFCQWQESWGTIWIGPFCLTECPGGEHIWFMEGAPGVSAAHSGRNLPLFFLWTHRTQPWSTGTWRPVNLGTVLAGADLWPRMNGCRTFLQEIGGSCEWAP